MSLNGKSGTTVSISGIVSTTNPGAETSLTNIDTGVGTTNTLLGTSNTLLQEIEEDQIQTGDLGTLRYRVDRGDDFGTGRTVGYGSIISDNNDNTEGFKVSNPVNTTYRTAGLTSINIAINRVTFPPLQNNNTFYIASSSNNDIVTTGSGARKVFVQYVAMVDGDDNTWENGSLEVSLNGQTSVTIPSSLRIIRINRMLISEVGASSTNEGAVCISTVDDFASGIPQTNIVNACDNGYSYSSVGIYSSISKQRVYFTRGSYYSTATSSKTMRNTQYSTFPWSNATPNTNRITWFVSDLSISQGVGFNTSGSAPEFPHTDIEFIAQGNNAGTINATIFWNTLRVVDPAF